jgi:siroheme synthase (precorrin-2 oxidase/ferrochelatase)
MKMSENEFILGTSGKGIVLYPLHQELKDQMNENRLVIGTSGRAKMIRYQINSIIKDQIGKKEEEKKKLRDVIKNKRKK